MNALNIIILAVLLYLAFVASYLLWLHLDKIEKSREKHEPSWKLSLENPQEIIGKSKFRLPAPETLKPADVKPEPLGPTTVETGKEEEKADTFVLSKADGDTPEEDVEPDDTEENEPLPIEVYLEVEDEEAEDEDESEEVPGLKGAAIAGGLTFEDMGEAVTAVIHHPEASGEECRKAGKILSELENTAFFEKLAESAPGRRDIVAELMDFHLKEYAKSKTARGQNPRIEIPADFDVNDLVEQLKK